MTNHRKPDNDSIIRLVRTLRYAGWTFQRIGDLLGISRQAAHQWLRYDVTAPGHKPFVKTLIKRR